MVDSEGHDSMTILTFSKINFFKTSESTIVIQVSKVTSGEIYRTTLLVGYVKEVDILLGNFNINSIKNEASAGVSNFLTEYKLVVSEPTHMEGGLLDHLYLMKQFLVRKHVNSTIKNIYFSDQDAVKIHIQKENSEKIDKDIDFAISYCSSC